MEKCINPNSSALQKTCSPLKQKKEKNPNETIAETRQKRTTNKYAPCSSTYASYAEKKVKKKCTVSRNGVYNNNELATKIQSSYKSKKKEKHREMGERNIEVEHRTVVTLELKSL